MWNCPKCDEAHEDTFGMCWQCGTDRSGKEDPSFDPPPDTSTAVREFEAEEHLLKWQFSLRGFFVLISWVALTAGVIRGIPEIFLLALLGIIAANSFGLIVALFVTYVLGFPNDGSPFRRGGGTKSSWAAQVRAASADDGGEADVAIPLCLHCARPVSPLHHYCPHCGQSVGQLTSYLPYEAIWFNAGMWGNLWDRLWYKNTDSVARKCFFFIMILFGAPVLLLALPTVWWWKSRATQQT